MSFPLAATAAQHAAPALWSRLLHDFPAHRLRPYAGVGIPGTIKLMGEAACGLRGEKHVGLIRFVREIVRGVKAKDYPSEIAAFYYWMCCNGRYVRDPVHNEYVEDPVAFIERGLSSDCDEWAALAAAGCQILGNPCRFVTVGFKPTPTPDFTHVFTQAFCSRSNAWLTVDPVAGPMTPAMQKAAVWWGAWPIDADMGRHEIRRLR